MKNFIEKFHDWEEKHDVFRSIGAIVFVGSLMLLLEVFPILLVNITKLVMGLF